jgi:hypothetical protein
MDEGERLIVGLSLLMSRSTFCPLRSSGLHPGVSRLRRACGAPVRACGAVLSSVLSSLLHLGTSDSHKVLISGGLGQRLPRNSQVGDRWDQRPYFVAPDRRTLERWRSFTTRQRCSQRVFPRQREVSTCIGFRLAQALMLCASAGGCTRRSPHFTNADPDVISTTPHWWHRPAPPSSLSRWPRSPTVEAAKTVVSFPRAQSEVDGCGNWQFADAPACPAPSQVFEELRSVAKDLPAFATAPLYRRWHLQWGTTTDEAARSLPGDALLPHAQFKATRGISIDAPPNAVWPWLVQAGGGRAGWYSNDLLDNLGHPSATTIVPDLQHLEVGQWVPMSPFGTPSDHNAFKVDSFEANQWMLWTKPDSTWLWHLTPIDGGGTRLVTRIQVVYDWHHPLMATLGVVLMEFGDFAMCRRMLRGIKTRSEAFARETRAGPLVIDRVGSPWS